MYSCDSVDGIILWPFQADIHAHCTYKASVQMLKYNATNKCVPFSSRIYYDYAQAQAHPLYFTRTICVRATFFPFVLFSGAAAAASAWPLSTVTL